MHEETIRIERRPLLLTHDDVEEFVARKGDKCGFRIRVWQAVNEIPVVMISQVPEGFHPLRLGTKLANFVNQSILGFPEEGFSVFFADREGSTTPVRYMTQMYFEVFGAHSARMKFFKPKMVFRGWSYVEGLVGETIEL